MVGYDVMSPGVLPATPDDPPCADPPHAGKVSVGNLHRHGRFDSGFGHRRELDLPINGPHGTLERLLGMLPDHLPDGLQILRR